MQGDPSLMFSVQTLCPHQYRHKCESTPAPCQNLRHNPTKQSDQSHQKPRVLTLHGHRPWVLAVDPGQVSWGRRVSIEGYWEVGRSLGEKRSLERPAGSPSHLPQPR